MTSVHSPRYRRLLERLLWARREAGLTQVEVARRFRRPQSFVSKCESGERRVDAVELGDFGRIYGKPLSFFVGEGEDPVGGASVSSERTRTQARRRRRRRRARARGAPPRR